MKAIRLFFVEGDRLGVDSSAMWGLFPANDPSRRCSFLIQTGRGASLAQITDEECERLLNRLYDLSQTTPFGIKTTGAPHYQRVVWQREDARLRAGLPAQAVERRRQLRAPRSGTPGAGHHAFREYNRPQPGSLSSGTMPVIYEAAFRHES